MFFKNIYLFIWLHWVLSAACGIFNLCWGMKDLFSCVIQNLRCSMWDLVPWPGTEPRLPALEAGSLRHWTIREVTKQLMFKCTLQTNTLSEGGAMYKYIWCWSCFNDFLIEIAFFFLLAKTYFPKKGVDGIRDKRSTMNNLFLMNF